MYVLSRKIKKEIQENSKLNEILKIYLRFVKIKRKKINIYHLLTSAKAFILTV